MKGIISCAHPEIALAADYALQAGGNAFDAAIAGLLTACVAEPCVASFSAGLIGMIQPAGHATRVVDGFAIAPAERIPGIESELHLLEVDFVNAIDKYYYGRGSVAATGYFHSILSFLAYANMPLREHIAIVLPLLKKGIPLTDFSVVYLKHLKPTFISDSLYELYTDNNADVLKPENLIINNGFIDLLETIKDEGADLVTKGEVVDEIHQLIDKQGHLTRDDLINYKLSYREANAFNYNNTDIYLAGYPSWGSRIIEELLIAEEEVEIDLHIYRCMEAISNNNLLSEWKEEQEDLSRKFGGTGHLSIADEASNILALSYSLGEGSGLMTPYSGIHLNNMLGEPALFSGKVDSWKSSEKLVSMMSPTILKSESYSIALGSGGSERIPQIMYQLIRRLSAMLAKGDISEMQFAKAIEKDRAFYKNGFMHIEPNYKESGNNDGFEYNRFEEKGLFYGGVNGVALHQTGKMIAHGDSRRLGYAKQIGK